jgi:hypothetical protein
MKRDESNFFAPYKSLGEVCSEIPPVYQHVPYRKDQGFVCCAIGNAVCAYTIQPFRLRHISNTLPDRITILARDKNHLFAAFGGNKIAMLRHNRMVSDSVVIMDGGTWGTSPFKPGKMKKFPPRSPPTIFDKF